MLFAQCWLVNAVCVCAALRAAACCTDLYSSSGAAKPRMLPSPEVVSQLFPHQQEALAWMIGRENSNALPPFWQQQQHRGGGGGGGVYTNSLTNYETQARPEPLR